MSSKGLFITGTGTDIGKTYVTALLIKKMRECGFHCGYYKAAISGADSIAASDAGYVNAQAGIGQEESSLLSYLYQTAVSPHLASAMEGNPVELSKVEKDYQKVSGAFDYVVTEGSGGIICPLRYDSEQKIMLTDVIRLLRLPVVIVADAGLGTINSTVLTIHYLLAKQFCVKGVLLNHYDDSLMHRDNLNMLEALTGSKVLAVVRDNDEELHMDTEALASLFA